MKWSYDLCGAEPIIKDMPVYDAASLAYGELLMLSAGTFTAGAGGHCLVTAAPSTVGANQAVDAMGICLEALDTDNATSSTGFVSTNPSVATAIKTTVAEPVCMAKVIINPFAVYRAAVSTANAVDITTGRTAASDELTVLNFVADLSDGCWIAFSNSAGGCYGDVRRIVTSGTTGTLDLSHTASAASTTSDDILIFSPKLTNSSVLLNGNAVAMGSITTAGYSATNLRVVENYINGEVMKESIHDAEGYSNKSGVGHIEQEIMMKDHVFGVQE